MTVCAHCINEIKALAPVRCGSCGYPIHTHCPFWLWEAQCQALQKVAKALENV